MSLSVIIPSKSISNILPCLAAVRKHEPYVDIIVVDDGIDWGGFDIDRFAPIAIVHGDKPFVFARNMNIGILEAGEADVILLNDDALLETPGGFTAMASAAGAGLVGYGQGGVVSASTNLAGNLQQRRQDGTALREVKLIPGHSAPVVAFVCVLIMRTVLREVGLLDERFTAYGWDDNDYCRRAHDSGHLIGVYDGCYVDHSKLTSSYRGGPAKAGNIEPGRVIYMDKWGTL